MPGIIGMRTRRVHALDTAEESPSLSLPMTKRTGPRRGWRKSVARGNIGAKDVAGPVGRQFDKAFGQQFHQRNGEQRACRSPNRFRRIRITAGTDQDGHPDTGGLGCSDDRAQVARITNPVEGEDDIAGLQFLRQGGQPALPRYQQQILGIVLAGDARQQGLRHRHNLRPAGSRLFNETPQSLVELTPGGQQCVARHEPPPQGLGCEF